MIGRRRLLAAAALVFPLLLAPAPALAAEAGEATVLLVRPPAASPDVDEALVHLAGELAAAGFRTQTVALALGPDVRASLEPVSAGAAVVAVVAIVAVAPMTSASATATATAELWVVDRVTGKTVVRRVRADGDPARLPQILSVRAVELLRASFVELAIANARQAPGAPEEPQVVRWAAAGLARPRPAWTWAFEAGGSMLASFDGLGGTFLPVARLERAMGTRVLARVSGAGLGARVHVATPAGPADVTQDLVLAEVALRFRPPRMVQPLLSAGAGALRVSASGRSSWPYEGAGGVVWAAALDAGAGTRLILRHRVEVGIELHALFAQPYPVVRFFDTEVARAGRPSLLASITLVGGL